MEGEGGRGREEGRKGERVRTREHTDAAEASSQGAQTRERKNEIGYGKVGLSTDVARGLGAGRVEGHDEPLHREARRKIDEHAALWRFSHR